MLPYPPIHEKRYILLSIFAAFFILFYWLSAPDSGGKQRLLSRSGFDMNSVSCDPIPYYIYTPFPLSLIDTESTRFKFRLSESEFDKFKNKYHHLLKFRDDYNGEVDHGNVEYKRKDVPLFYAAYTYSTSRLITFYYAPSLSELKIVVSDH